MRGYRNRQLILPSVVNKSKPSLHLADLPQSPCTHLSASSQTHPALPILPPSFHPHLAAAPPGTSLNLTLFCHFPNVLLSIYLISQRFFYCSSTFSHFLSSQSSCSLCAVVTLLNSSIPLKLIGRIDTRDEGKLRKYTSVS